MSMPPSAHAGTLSANIQMGGRPTRPLLLTLNTCIEGQARRCMRLFT